MKEQTIKKQRILTIFEHFQFIMNTSGWSFIKFILNRMETRPFSLDLKVRWGNNDFFVYFHGFVFWCIKTNFFYDFNWFIFRCIVIWTDTTGTTRPWWFWRYREAAVTRGWFWCFKFYGNSRWACENRIETAISYSPTLHHFCNAGTTDFFSASFV